MKRAVTLAATLAICVAVQTMDSFAGEIRGKVRITGTIAVQEATANPYPGQLGSVTETIESPVPAGAATEVVLYLEGALGTAPNVRPKLYQINASFQPHVIGIPVGASVEFPNQDAILHNVFSYSKTKRFDLGYYGKGKSRTVKFDKPGLVKVFCDIHSTMSAFIYVADSPFVTQPDENGEYAFKNVPEGRYTLRVWHPDHGDKSHEATVTGAVTTINVTL